MVGYQAVNVPSGFSMRAATFEAINGDYKISEIKVSDDIQGGGSDYVQKINADGTWGDVYFYLTMNGTGYVEDGWYKDDFGGTPVTDKDVLRKGEAVIVTSASQFAFTFSGQIPASTSTIAIPTGFSMVGNPTPAAVKIGSIVVSEAVHGGGSDYAQKINADGTWGDVYFYLTMNGTGYVEDGWYKDDFGGTPVTDEDVLEAGESMIFTSAGDFSVTFPACL